MYNFDPAQLIILKQFLSYSAEKNPCCIFHPGAFNIKPVNSFFLVWHSDYELSSKTQKPFLILKESIKCLKINYRAKSHVVMFCFGLQSIARFINTNASYFNTHRLESEGKFSRNFQVSVGKKIKGRSVLGETVPSVWNTAVGLRPRVVLKTSGTVSPKMDLPAGE